MGAVGNGRPSDSWRRVRGAPLPAGLEGRGGFRKAQEPNPVRDGFGTRPPDVVASTSRGLVLWEREVSQRVVW